MKTFILSLSAALALLASSAGQAADAAQPQDSGQKRAKQYQEMLAVYPLLPLQILQGPTQYLLDTCKKTFPNDQEKISVAFDQLPLASYQLEVRLNGQTIPAGGLMLENMKKAIGPMENNQESAFYCKHPDVFIRQLMRSMGIPESYKQVLDKVLADSPAAPASH
ncbi:hypothetical protein KIF53_21850 [Chromobacterium subtsugae]|uniref:Uncharacterized protein n=1 Tax=Chromobacterium subtsugae TaxID=251747 RepID=A0ABS7FJM3_9NEIS|nr:MULTISPECIES: hypothetical protein [Chromobacterium]MBW7569168.1 hypothetical protein [Chromobacterium subtsugae]MBW8290285.1 hypothetical protein [Chromobacterium subtsugae]WSE92335.1 hypothetical protein U6115_03550 [Chromobacterium subtsugae]WVH60713.1 hypothetical protein U6151_03570 [Chromobacterium subtsugae]